MQTTIASILGLALLCSISAAGAGKKPPAKLVFPSKAGEIAFDQRFQVVTGTIKTSSGTARIENGRLRGDEITFTAGSSQYTGRVTGDTIQGQVTGPGAERAWRATRAKS